MAFEAREDAYADYAYYTDEYGGTVLTEEKFGSAVIWSTALIDQMTFGRVRSLSEIPSCVSDAACSAAEKYATFRDAKARGFASESNDGYSVSYAGTGDGAMDSMMSSVRQEIKVYLANTGLLYRGVRP